MDMPQPHAARRQRQTQEWSGATTAAETIRFSCSICLDGVVEPVVTQCGHLYCWPCLYQWLEPGLLPGERQTLTGTLAVKPVDESRRVCPVCKSPCSTPTLVPIYALVERPREEKEEEDHQQQQQLEQLAGNDPAKKQQRPSKTVSLSNQEENDNDDNSRDRSHRTNATATRTGLRYRSTAMTTTTTTATTTTNSLANPFQNTPPRPAPRRMLHSTVLLTPTANNAANTTTTTTSSSSSTTTNNNTMTQPQRPAIGTTSPIGSAFRRPQVPPLHFYGGQDSMQGGAEHSAAAYAQDDPDATEYLSRILLLMGSFVILCLLLF